MLARASRRVEAGAVIPSPGKTCITIRFLGVAGPGDPRLRAISPIEHVDAVTFPVLLIHGRDDTVVPYGQSEEMAKALKRAGKSVDLISLPHEDHWLSHGATREQMLEAIVSFLGRNDPPG